MTTVSVPIPGTNWGIWNHAFQGPNTNWLFEQREIAGNFFLGLQGQAINIFDAGIPKGAIIESATMRVTAFQNSASIFTTNLNTSSRSSALLVDRPMASPLTHFIGWRPDQWSNADMRLDSNTASLIIETSGGTNNSNWNIRQIQAAVSPGGVSPSSNRGHRERMAQRFTMPVVGNSTIGSVELQMFRTGLALPFTNLRVQIMGAVLDGGSLVPDEIVLATSSNVTYASIPTAPATGAPITFSFVGGEQITLTAGTDYFIVLDPDPYPLNNADYLTLRHQNTFLSTGRLWHYGEGIGMDWQNFPGVVDSWQVTENNPGGTDIPWAPPNFITGVNYFTPDISALVQSQVNDPDYGEDRGITITVRDNVGGTPSRIWRSAAHPSNLPPRLDVTYRRRRISVF